MRKRWRSAPAYISVTDLQRGLTYLRKSAEYLIKDLRTSFFPNLNTLEIAWAKAGSARQWAGPDRPSEEAGRSPTSLSRDDLQRGVL
jgi:hypothetical protein